MNTPLRVTRDMTLSDVLTQLGFEHAPTASRFNSKRHVLLHGQRVITGGANDVWSWLDEQGLIERNYEPVARAS